MKDIPKPKVEGKLDSSQPVSPMVPPKLSKAGQAAMRGVAPSQERKDHRHGEFLISNWSGYPDGPKPKGPFRILGTKEYAEARQKANQVNHDLHSKDRSLKHKQIHEIKPVKFGGSPTDFNNKIALSRHQHARYTAWWNHQLKGQNQE